MAVARPGPVLAAVLLLGAAACERMPSVPGTGPSVRHVAGAEYYRDGSQYHLFIFDPSEPRPLDDRIRLARNTIASEGACSWVEAPRAHLRTKTAEQGARYADTMLVAPLRCG